MGVSKKYWRRVGLNQLNISQMLWNALGVVFTYRIAAFCWPMFPSDNQVAVAVDVAASCLRTCVSFIDSNSSKNAWYASSNFVLSLLAILADILEYNHASTRNNRTLESTYRLLDVMSWLRRYRNSLEYPIVLVEESHIRCTPYFRYGVIHIHTFPFVWLRGK